MSEFTDRRATTVDRLDRIQQDLAGLREDFEAFTKAQEQVNANVRDHLVRSSSLGDYHEETYNAVQRVQQDHASRLRAVEDWRVEMRTLGMVLKLTFGVSILGAIIGIVSLVNMIATFGR